MLSGAAAHAAGRYADYMAAYELGRTEGFKGLRIGVPRHKFYDAKVTSLPPALFEAAECAQSPTSLLAAHGSQRGDCKDQTSQGFLMGFCNR